MDRDLIAIGASAGSLELLGSIVAALPGDFTGNVFITVHVGHGPSMLPDLLARRARVPVEFARAGEPIRPGRVYVAPPNRHLLVERDRLELSRGPREHFTRPAIDPMFRSAAAAHGERVIGVVLSGGGSDGAAGLDAIQRACGLAVVLDPREAIAPDMPQAAAEIIRPDCLVSADQLPQLLVRLARERVAESVQPPSAAPEPIQMPERPLTLTCPDCGGALREIGGDAALQYRCHIGHIFGGAEMLPAQLEMLEKALGTAQRVLNERVELSRLMVAHARRAGRRHGIRYWQRLQDEAEKQSEIIREVLSGPAIEPPMEDGQRPGELVELPG